LLTIILRIIHCVIKINIFIFMA